MSQDYQPEIEFVLMAYVDGEQVYQQSSALTEVIAQSLGDAQHSVDFFLEEQNNRAEAEAYSRGDEDD